MAPTPDALQPQDLALELVGTYAPDGEAVWAGGLVRLLEELGFSHGAARVALARVVKRGGLARVRNGRLVSYTVTPEAAQALQAADERILRFGRGEWDGVWTIVSSFLPDEQRTERHRLSRRLRFLGFGSVQDATWIAAHDREPEVVALAEELGVREHVGLFVGRPGGTLGLDALIGRAWSLGELAALYERFTADYGTYRRAGARRRLDDREAFLVRTLATDRFRRFALLDPELPESLAGKPLARDDAVATFHALHAGLAKSAARYVASATAPPAPR